MLFYAADAPSWTDKLEAWATLFAAVFSAAAFISAVNASASSTSMALTLP